MRKIFIILIFLVLIPNPVKAVTYDCSKYQCITCETAVMGTTKVTYKIFSSGSGTAAMDFKGDNPGGIFTYQNSMESTNFISKEKNSLVCPDIYVELASSARLQTVRIFGLQDKNKTRLKKEMKKTEDNKKPFMKTNNPTSKPSEGEDTIDKTKNCSYSANGVTATVVVANGQLDIQLNPPKYKLAVTDLKADMFIDKCPVLQFACVDSQNICSIFKESESGGHESEGETTDNADDLDKKNDEIDRMPAHSVNPSLDAALKRSACEIIPTTSKTFEFIKKIIGYVEIGTIFLVLVLGMLDLAGAVGSQEDGAFKKAGTKFGKRLIAGALVFLVPTLVGLLIGLINDNACTDAGLGELYTNK